MDNRNKAKRDFRRQNIAIAERALERSVWGKGIYTQHLAVPAARPSQIRAGARKLYDVIQGQARKRQRAA